MITFFFVMLMLGVFGKMIGLAIRATWGLTKVLFTIVFLPLILIAMVIGGLVQLAIPALIIIGIVMLVKSIVDRPEVA